jgi:hypothetical protein
MCRSSQVPQVPETHRSDPAQSCSLAQLCPAARETQPPDSQSISPQQSDVASQ